MPVKGRLCLLLGTNEVQNWKNCVYRVVISDHKHKRPKLTIRNYINCKYTSRCKVNQLKSMRLCDYAAINPASLILHMQFTLNSIIHHRNETKPYTQRTRDSATDYTYTNIANTHVERNVLCHSLRYCLSRQCVPTCIRRRLKSYTTECMCAVCVCVCLRLRPNLNLSLALSRSFININFFKHFIYRISYITS